LLALKYFFTIYAGPVEVFETNIDGRAKQE